MPEQYNAGRPGRFRGIGVLSRTLGRVHATKMPWELQRGIYQRGFDTSVFNIVQPLVDSNAAATDTTATTITTSRADSSTGIDSTTKVATTARADNSTGTDVATKVGTTVKADVSTGGDATSKFIVTVKADSSTGIDVTTRAIISKRTDSSTGVDTVTSKSIVTARTDSSTGTDNGTAIRFAVTSRSDVGTGVDSFSAVPRTAINLADTNSGGTPDAPSKLLVSAKVDTGTGADSLTLTAAELLQISDSSAVGSGQIQLQVGKVCSDNGSGNDLVANRVVVAFADVGSGSDVEYSGDAPPAPPQIWVSGGLGRDYAAKQPAKQAKVEIEATSVTISCSDAGSGTDVCSPQSPDVEFGVKTNKTEKPLYVEDILRARPRELPFATTRSFTPPVAILEKGAADFIVELLVNCLV